MVAKETPRTSAISWLLFPLTYQGRYLDFLGRKQQVDGGEALEKGGDHLFKMVVYNVN